MLFSKKSRPSPELKQTKQVNVVSEKDIEGLITRGTKTSLHETAVIELVDAVLSFAHAQRASDIHIEPWTDRGLIRLRIDGILLDRFEIPPALQQQIVARLKIMTDMRTDEHRAPQDGRLSFNAGESVDVRVSIIATAYGEKVVMRLLSSATHKLSLEDLGCAPSDLDRIQTAIGKPWGMILATGPTGSGKTTTIYAILEQLNQRSVNISTIEDPVEFKIAGVNQSQVDRSAEFTFATGLRSLLRQDPDIIMVGEIRDTETAKIAVNAALTGHRMLSTVHTNDAATTIPRLIDMGAEPFLVASTFNCAIAQRLMRRVCDDCAQESVLKQDVASQVLSADVQSILFGKAKSVKVKEAKGCAKCSGTGYRGRVGIFEVLLHSPAIEKLIIEHADSSMIRTQAIQEGMRSLEQDAIEKVKIGVSTMKEFVRVLHE